MLLPGFIHLGLMFMLATYSTGLDWDIHVTKKQQASPGSDKVVECTFTYPEMYHTNDIKVTWKTFKKRDICAKEDMEANAFIFHHNDKCVDNEYRGRTSIIGDQTKGNCTLKINNVRNDLSIYMRVFAKDNFSFYNGRVSISVTDGVGSTPNPKVKTFTGLTSQISFIHQTMVTPSKMELNQLALYVGILVPATALVIILIVFGVFFHVKNKRSLSLPMCMSEGIPKKDSFSNKRETTINEPESHDEPIYMNTETATAENNQREDPTEHIYGNVNYLKH